MAIGDLAQSSREAFELLPPRRQVVHVGDFAQHCRDEQVEEVLLAFDVVVQGHRRGAQAGRDGGHRHRGQALLVCDGAGAVDDVGAREARCTWHRSPSRQGNYTSYTYAVHRLIRLCLAAAAAVSAVAITSVVALSGVEIGYTWRVISHGQSSTDDLEWKRHLTIPAESPTPWTSPDQCGDVRKAAGGSLDAALLPGGATQLVVIRHGELICQWAAPGHRIEELRPVFSISKTVTALLISRAVEAGKMSWKDPITHWIPELGERDHRFADITLADLVDMRSGIGFRVVARFPWFNEDAPRVYYASDLEAATLDDPAVESAPGTFTYNDWAPNLLGIAYRRATGRLMTGPDATELWSSLCAEHSAQWLVDGHGFPWHESGFVATAPDIARIGQLLLDDRTSDFARRSAVATTTPIASPVLLLVMAASRWATATGCGSSTTQTNPPMPHSVTTVKSWTQTQRPTPSSSDSGTRATRTSALSPSSPPNSNTGHAGSSQGRVVRSCRCVVTSEVVTAIGRSAWLSKRRCP